VSVDPEDLELEGLDRRPLHWQRLAPEARSAWFERLWEDVCLLRDRYRLSLRAGWWEDGIQVEALAAMAAWVERYDSGEWDDPPGKLSLLFELERLETLLRDGHEPFLPDRDHQPFREHVRRVGTEQPPEPTG
jgi:hypothetical protein